MFTYFKYFSIVGFVLVLTGALIFGMYFRSVAATNIIMAAVEQNNRSLASSYVENIWNIYIAQYSERLLSASKETDAHDAFVKDSMYYLRLMPFMQLNIYTPKRALVLSTNKDTSILIKAKETRFTLDNLFNKQVKQSDFDKALRGNVSSSIVSGKAKTPNENSFRDVKLIHTFIPVFSLTDKTRVSSVIEIYYDITSSWRYLTHFQIIGTVGVITIFTALYLVFFYTSRRAARIIEKQHDANLELQSAKTRAEVENEEKSTFLANVSHELRTPLNAIIGFSEIIKDEVMGPVGSEQYKDYVKDINNSGVHLLSLINDILDYSKADARKLEVDRVSMDLNKVIHSSIRLVLPRAQDAEIILEKQLPQHHLIMMGDPKRMKQVVLNLLTNAIKFTPPSKKVEISAWEDTVDGRITIMIKDEGIGIAPKDISKALSMFGQVDSRLSRRYEGTGLGLPLTKKLVEIMEGTFEIQSELEKGTQITLTFPPMDDKSINDPPATIEGSDNQQF